MANWGAAGKGALAGAATGATVGSIIPGYGTAIGAAAGGLIGGLSGLFSGDDDKKLQYQDRDQILRLINQGYAPGGLTSLSASRVGASQLGLGGDQFRSGQLQQVGQLQRVASGQQQGAGELAAHRQIQNALASQQAQARLARGGNSGLAYRDAANQSAALGITGAGLGQQSALQDQQAAQAQLIGALSQGRAGDINVASQNAQLQQQAGIYNAQAQQAQQNQNAQNYLALLQQLQSMDAGQIGGATQSAIANQQLNQSLLGAGLSAGGQILASRLGSSGGGAPVAPNSYSGALSSGGLVNPYAP